MNLKFDFVAVTASFLSLGQSDDYIYLDNIELCCLEHQIVSAELWTDSVAPKVHPNPELPLDEIMNNSVVGNVLELGGFTGASDWAVWRIRASSFIIKWSGEPRFYTPCQKVEQVVPPKSDRAGG